MEKNQHIVIALLILIIGFGGGYIVRGGEAPEAGKHMMPNGMMMNNNGMGMDNAMDDMMAGLQGKTGDDFDRAFLSEMIMHHQGAVAMAQAALKNASHAEIKNMAQAIITAQTTEIDQMMLWGRNWYGTQ